MIDWSLAGLVCVLGVALIVQAKLSSMASSRMVGTLERMNERLLHAALARDAREFSQLDKASKHATAAVLAAAPPSENEEAKRREYEAFAAGQLASMGYEGFESPPLMPDGL